MKYLQRPLLSLLAIFGFAVASQATVIVDDTWSTGTFTNWNLPTRCPWYYYDSTTNLYMTGTTNALYCTNYSTIIGSSLKYWWTFFVTNDPALTVPLPPGMTNIMSGNTNIYHGQPIDIQPGQMLKVTLSFIPNGFLMDQSKTRFGLFSYDQADFGTVTRSTKNYGKSGTNVTGYYVQVPLQATFSSGNNLFSIRCRTNLNVADSVEPMGKDTVFWALGGGAGITNASGFLLDNQYTLEIDVARYAGSNVITCAIAGNLGGVVTNYTHSRVDVSGRNWHKFDCFAIRMDGSFPTPDTLILKEFKVEVLPIDFAVVGDRIDADSYRLTYPTYPGFNYQAQFADDLGAVTWSTFDSYTATDHTGASTNNGTTGIDHRFYRVVNTPP